MNNLDAQDTVAAKDVDAVVSKLLEHASPGQVRSLIAFAKSFNSSVHKDSSGEPPVARVLRVVRNEISARRTTM